VKYFARDRIPDATTADFDGRLAPRSPSPAACWVGSAALRTSRETVAVRRAAVVELA
jgi:hypothetical protein